MEIREAGRQDLGTWLVLRSRLWPDAAIESLRDGAMQQLSSTNDVCFLLVDSQKGPVGFLEGAVHPGPAAPYAHVEGWYVEPAFRRKGHGGSLVNSFEEWCLHRRIVLLTSDTAPEYPISPAAHLGAGFDVLSHQTIFIKRLGGGSKESAVRQAFTERPSPVIRRIETADHPACVAIAGTLPEWFTETARTIMIPVDLRHQMGFLAERDGDVVGFVTLYVAEARLNIGWLAVHRDRRRRGIGSALLRRSEEAAVELGIRELATYTLGDGVDYEPYVHTRAFYERQGFRVYQRHQTDNPECPEEVRISKRVG